MSDESVFERYRAMVEEDLERRLPGEESRDRAGRIGEAMRYAVLGGGKRLRPMLVLSACEASGADAQRALAGACAVEFIHAYSLVHDDLPAMDDDDMRRGKPSCHKAFGEATAILTGDALLTAAFETLTRPPERMAQLKAAAELGRLAGWYGLVGGQQLDLDLENTDSWTFQDVERVHLGKTAALFEASAVIGALLAEASDEDVERMRSFGNAVGLAFQHIDDVLDQEHQEFGEKAKARTEELLARAKSLVAEMKGNTQGLETLVLALDDRMAKALEGMDLD